LILWMTLLWYSIRKTTSKKTKKRTHWKNKRQGKL